MIGPAALRNQIRQGVALLSMAIAVGSASAFFLWSLDAVTLLRFKAPWLIWLLPIAGLLIVWIYQKFGNNSAAGTNLILDEIHEPSTGVPGRMAALVLLGTLVTHLFGGSAGREGTALQMGGGIAGSFARWFELEAKEIRLLLMAGIAAGFGSVFGTPIAGALFAAEVIIIGRIQYHALIPCFIASLVAHFTCLAWGAHHTHYTVAAAGAFYHPQWRLIVLTVLAAVAFGFAATLFTWSSHWLARFWKRHVSRELLRPVFGGLIVIGLYLLLGTSDYLGLGVLGDSPDAVTLPAMFHSEDIPSSAWIWKLVFTVVTLSAGFKGGEVTPLFFIGAALGNTLAWWFGAPIDLFAAMGFVAIFAAASNTPLASTVLGMELFGVENGLYFATACFIAQRFSSRRGIYGSQRIAVAVGKDK